MKQPIKISKNTDITYQVGWKKGTIRLRENRLAVEMNRKESLIYRYIWRPVGFLPASLLAVLLCALPILGLFFIVKLMYLLLHY